MCPAECKEILLLSHKASRHIPRSEFECLALSGGAEQAPRRGGPGRPGSPRPRMVAMGMRYYGAPHGAGGVDIEVTRGTIEAMRMEY